MYVLIHHQIQDAKAFWETVEQDPTPPAGMKVVTFFPSTDNTAAFCLYEADSTEALRRFVDGALGTSSRNSYYPVNADAAVGLPV